MDLGTKSIDCKTWRPSLYPQLQGMWEQDLVLDSAESVTIQKITQTLLTHQNMTTFANPTFVYI